MTKHLWSMLLLCLLGLAACGGGEGNPSADATGTANSTLIQWDRAASTVVFRAEVRGGQGVGTFLERNVVPPCTIYGNNVVVWVVESPTIQVLYDQLTDAQIIDFVNYLTFRENFFGFSAGMDLLPPQQVAPTAETLVLNINGVLHTSDIYGGWDYEYYLRILDACKRLSTAPVEFLPDGAWVSAVSVPYDSQAPTLIWDAQASGLSLRQLAETGERVWLEGRIVAVLWNMLLQSATGVHFREGDGDYNLAVEVPNVTLVSPGAP